MRRWLYNLFYGRRGFDRLGYTAMISSLVLMLVSGFVGVDWLSVLLYAVALAGYAYSIWRALSRNLVKRQRENDAFCEFFRIQRLRIKERKTHKYFRCPACRAWVRVPKGRGEITITCRACSHRFDKRS